MKRALQCLSLLVFAVSLWCFDGQIAFTLKNAHTLGPKGETHTLTSLQIEELVHAHHLLDYQLSSMILENVWEHYQTVTHLWPIKLEAQSQNYFYRLSETIPNECQEVEKKSEVKLAVCR